MSAFVKFDKLLPNLMGSICDRSTGLCSGKETEASDALPATLGMASGLEGRPRTCVRKKARFPRDSLPGGCVLAQAHNREHGLHGLGSSRLLFSVWRREVRQQVRQGQCLLPCPCLQVVLLLRDPHVERGPGLLFL